jgi:hypothetical protein
VSVRGPVIGFGAGIIIVDDLRKADEALKQLHVMIAD